MSKETKQKQQEQMQGEQLDAHTVIAVQRNRIMELEDNLTQALAIANQYKLKYNSLIQNANKVDEDVKPEGTE
jgi:hypothetical protein